MTTAPSPCLRTPPRGLAVVALLALLGLGEAGCGDAPAWQVELDGLASAPVRAPSGELLVVTSAPTLWAIDREGQVRWKVPLEGETVADSRLTTAGPLWPVVTPGGDIVVAVAQSVVSRFSPQGTLRWRTDLPCEVSAGLALRSDESTVVPCAGGRLLLLGPDGALRWTFTDSGAAASLPWAPSPVVGPDDAIIGGVGYVSIVRVEPDGTRGWSHAVGGSTDGLSFAADGTILYLSHSFASESWRLAGLVALGQDGQVRWSAALPEGSFYEATVSSEGIHAVANAYDGRGAQVVRFGSTLSREEVELTGRPLAAPVVGEDGSRLIRTDDDALLWVDREGEKQERFALQGWQTPPVLGEDGEVYATTRTALVRLNLGTARAAQGPWAQPRGNGRASGALSPPAGD